MLINTIELQEGISGASLTAYIQRPYHEGLSKGDKPAIIICPGGAFMGITEKEAEPVALKYLSEGYQAFVLRYSIGAGFARFPAPFYDAAKAIMIVRENAVRWNINPDKICLCGFSTGGLVAAYLAASWKEEDFAKTLMADSELFKPNALILGYPLLDLEHFRLKNQNKSVEMNSLLEMMSGCIYGTYQLNNLPSKWNIIDKITNHMPPTFLWTTMEDTYADVEDCFEMIKALARQKISYEFHIFEHGQHGTSLGDHTVGNSPEEVRQLGNTNEWFSLAKRWLDKQ